jgi:LuxR family maltose regulon positive regulatory protein
MQSLMLGEHALAAQATSWTIATKARLGMLDDARRSLADVPPTRSGAGEIRNAAAVISLEAGDPDAALAELRDVLDERAPVIHDFTLVEAHLLAAHAYHARGDERKANAALEKALALAERDLLILPFALTGSRDLLAALPRYGTSHAALLLEIVDLLGGAFPRSGSPSMLATDELSPSELRVLRYLPTNLSRPDIARALYVSVNTVNTHVRNIYAKLGASNRSEAVDRARRLRLLSAGATPQPSAH